MKKIQIGKPGKKTLIAGGAALGAALVAATLFPSVREGVACDASTDVQFSPGGKFRAQLTEKTCRWGVKPADPMQVQVDKQAQDGWSVTVPLDQEGGGHAAEAASPALKWKGANTLEVTVYTADTSGALVRRVEELTVTRRYVKAPKRKGGEGSA